MAEIREIKGIIEKLYFHIHVGKLGQVGPSMKQSDQWKALKNNLNTQEMVKRYNLVLGR